MRSSLFHLLIAHDKKSFNKFILFLYLQQKEYKNIILYNMPTLEIYLSAST